MLASVQGTTHFSPATLDKVARICEHFKKGPCLFLAIPHILIEVLRILTDKSPETSSFGGASLEDHYF